ncbi:MAG: hypothetical protein PHI99_10120, partial [Syntrophales bacterium]|nr:hypothetical protein [Syntrophales bacterium]
MPYEIRYLPVENLVVARIEGELTLENVKQLHLGLSGEMEKYGLKGCLLEMMDVGNGLDTVGIYEIPRFYDSVGTDKSAMVAV